jgi:DNA repair protein RadC
MSDQYSFDEMPLPRFKADAKGQPSYLKNHRQRLRDRFLKGGPDAVPDYELLELVLFRAIPRRDVKPLARQLIDSFGTFSATISAPIERLERETGIGPAVITELKIVEAAAHRLAQARILDKPAISGWKALVSYCRTTMAHSNIEQFRILFLDRKNVLVADEPQAKGTIDHVPVYPREVVKRALELDASALVLVHNHPSGDPTPSDADIAVTRQIEAAAQTFNIIIHDHLIIGATEEFSFRAAGHL